MAESSGQKIFDPSKCLPAEFELLGLLGEGSHGLVYKAILRTIDSPVAVKFIPTDFAHEEKALKSFQKEAKAIASLSHPNIVKVLQLGIGQDNTPYLVYEYLEGETLKHYLERKKTLSQRSISCLFQQLCSAIAQTHNQGVIHRDLKPANIMLLPEQSDSSIFHVKLLDFGIAKIISQDDAKSAISATSSQLNAGSPAYMSPEQCNASGADARSDIYSLACILHECLLGIVPLAGDSPTHTMYLQANQAPPLPNPKLTKSMNKLLSDCLSKDPNNRPQSVEELQKRLEAALKELDNNATAVGFKVLVPLSIVICAISAFLFAFSGQFSKVAKSKSQLPIEFNTHNETTSGQKELDAIASTLYQANHSHIPDPTIVSRMDNLIPKLGRRKDLMLVAYAFKAGTLSQLGKLSEASESWKSALKVCREISKNPNSQAAVCQRKLAELMLAKHQPDNALDYARQSIEEANAAEKANFANDIKLGEQYKTFDWREPVAEAHQQMARAYVQMHDYKAALENANLSIKRYSERSYALASKAEIVRAEIQVLLCNKKQALKELKEYLDKLIENDPNQVNPDLPAIEEAMSDVVNWYYSNSERKLANDLLRRARKLMLDHRSDVSPDFYLETQKHLQTLSSRLEQP